VCLLAESGIKAGQSTKALRWAIGATLDVCAGGERALANCVPN
jgi:hypothetical protein